MVSETTPLISPDSTSSTNADYNNASNTRTENVPTKHTFPAHLTTLDAFTLLTTIVIGSGVFSSPGPIDANVSSPGASLLIWLLGGILAWTGALTMAELGTAIPGEGGIQPYLTRIYGEKLGFLAAWSWITATMPATLAILSTVFVESVFLSLRVEGMEGIKKVWSLSVLFVVSAANCVSTKTSTRLGSFFVVVKFLSIFLLFIAGLTVVLAYAGNHEKDWGGGDWHEKNWFASRDTVLPDGSTIEWEGVSAWRKLGFYSTALYGALWAYSGWDKANYVAAELRNPTKQLPLAINTAIPTIILCYITANAVYYVLLPWNVVSITDAAAVTAITHFLGKSVAYFATLLICLVIAGSALGNSFVAGRMTVAAANKHWIPKFFGSVGEIGTWKVTKAAEDEAAEDAMNDGESPINAIILNALLSSIYILLGNMRILLTLNGLGEYAFFFLTVLGAIILRCKEPELHRPIKPFILIPALFAIISGFVVVRGAMFAPVQAGILVGIWVVGIVFYLVRGRMVR